MIYLIGTGRIALEYVKVLKNCGCEFRVIGNSCESVNRFKKKTGVEVLSGGVKAHLPNLEKKSFFINCVQVDNLDEVTKTIIQSEPERILVEKPGFISINSALNEKEYYKKHNNIYVACNRRFFDSVIQLKKILKKECPITAHFEFNERGAQIDSKFWNKSILSNWVFANSIHVIDTAFYLIGQPIHLHGFNNQKKLKWSSSDIFIGHGITDQNVYFTYNSNWISPGSWNIEIKTTRKTYILNPMETLMCRNHDGSIEKIIESDIKFKPGFKLQLDYFLKSADKLLSLNEYISNLEKQKQIYV